MLHFVNIQSIKSLKEFFNDDSVPEKRYSIFITKVLFKYSLKPQGEKQHKHYCLYINDDGDSVIYMIFPLTTFRYLSGSGTSGTHMQTLQIEAVLATGIIFITLLNVPPI